MFSGKHRKRWINLRAKITLTWTTIQEIRTVKKERKLKQNMEKWISKNGNYRISSVDHQAVTYVHRR